jgi:hypothetical protein
MISTTNLDLFAGIPVADYSTALKWYEQLLGSPPAFLPTDIETVWELAHAGHARHTLSLTTWVRWLHRSSIADSTARSGRPRRTACAGSRTAIPMETRSGWAALRCRQLI